MKVRQEIVTTSLLVGLVVGGSRQRHTWWTRRFVRQVDLAEEEEEQEQTTVDAVEMHSDFFCAYRCLSLGESCFGFLAGGEGWGCSTVSNPVATLKGDGEEDGVEAIFVRRGGACRADACQLACETCAEDQCNNLSTVTGDTSPTEGVLNRGLGGVLAVLAGNQTRLVNLTSFQVLGSLPENSFDRDVPPRRVIHLQARPDGSSPVLVACGACKQCDDGSPFCLWNSISGLQGESGLDSSSSSWGRVAIGRPVIFSTFALVGYEDGFLVVGGKEQTGEEGVVISSAVTVCHHSGGGGGGGGGGHGGSCSPHCHHLPVGLALMCAVRHPDNRSVVVIVGGKKDEDEWHRGVLLWDARTGRNVTDRVHPLITRINHDCTFFTWEGRMHLAVGGGETIAASNQVVIQATKVLFFDWETLGERESAHVLTRKWAPMLSAATLGGQPALVIVGNQKKGNERLSGKLEACKLQSDSICGGWEEVGDVGTILRLETAAITEVLP